MAEAEQQHRIAIESSGLRAEIADTRRGQWLGFGLAALAIVGAVIAAYIGAHWVVSAALVGIPVMAMIQRLINGRARGGAEPKS